MLHDDNRRSLIDSQSRDKDSLPFTDFDNRNSASKRATSVLTPPAPSPQLQNTPATPLAKRFPQRFIDATCLTLLIINLVPTAVIWFDSEFSHPLRESLPPVLAAVVLVFGIYFNRTKLATPPREKSWVGLTLLFCICIALDVLCILKMFHFMFLASVALVAFFVFAFHGLQRARSAFPLFFVSAFLLPDLPDSVRSVLSLPLQKLCTFLTLSICRLFIPITGSDHFFYICGRTYDVAPGCSGLSMLACFLFAFALFQTFESPKPFAYFAIFMFDPLMTIMLNTIRLVITAFCGYYVSQEYAISIHANLEFVLVPIGLLVLWTLGNKLRVIQES